MQKNELTLGTPKAELSLLSLLSLTAITARLQQTSLMKRLAELYSGLIDETVTPLQAVYALYAQLSLLAALSPLPLSAGWRACFLLLFVIALKCFVEKMKA